MRLRVWFGDLSLARIPINFNSRSSLTYVNEPISAHAINEDSNYLKIYAK